MRLVISAGGTGGHIYPALAILNKFKKCEKVLEVLYIGTHNRMETEIVPSHNIPFKSIKIYGFSKNILKDFKNCYLVMKAYYDVIDIFKEFRPDVVIGVGGYVTMPVIMAAKKLKIKCYIHEQNSIPGKTNKFLSRGVNAVFTSFEDSSKYFPQNINIVYSGNPSGENAGSIKSIPKTSLGFSKNKKLVLMVAGSLGSTSLNAKMVDFLKQCSSVDYEILYITGKSSYEEFKKNKFSDNVKVIPYLDNLSSFFKNCDLIISRAGAGVLSEIVDAKIPSILIPSPNVANNHQYYNALSLVNKNEALMLEEKDLTSDSLLAMVNDLLNNKEKYEKIKNNLKGEKTISSSEVIYNYIKEDLKDVK